MKIFGIAGHSGMGKTTLLERLIPELRRRGLTVSLMKHSHKAIDIDRPGKDSHRLREAGCGEVMLLGRERWALMHELRGEAEPTLDELLPHMAPCDLLLIEGFKGGDFPKLEVWRAAERKLPLWGQWPGIVAVATEPAPGAADDPLPACLRADAPPPLQLDLHDIQTIAELVLARAASWPDRTPIAVTAALIAAADNQPPGTPSVRAEPLQAPAKPPSGKVQPDIARAKKVQEVPAASFEQLDIFAHSPEVMLRNAVVDALSADRVDAARQAWQQWAEAVPRDPLLGDASALIDTLAQADSRAGAGMAMSPGERMENDLLPRSAALQGAVAQAASRVLHEQASAWLRRRWAALARQALTELPTGLQAWRADLAERHPARFFLKAGEGQAAAAAVERIESWRQVPQPLLWMAQARWTTQGADAGWPFLAEAFWRAPARAHELLPELADPRLMRLARGFEDEFEPDDPKDWRWFPAWLLCEQPLMLPVLELAQPPADTPAAEGFSILAALLRLERQGLQHEVLAQRQRLKACSARLLACYLSRR